MDDFEFTYLKTWNDMISFSYWFHSLLCMCNVHTERLSDVKGIVNRHYSFSIKSPSR